ncbi:MAG: cysteine synthase A [Bdellovibrionales bacterium]|nr:cysteine synthase A [Bdellovibrionales bacterium]
MTARISSLWDSVGNTPLLRIGTLSQRTGNQILGKAEFMNPGGSIKDRAAKGMIRDAEAKGLLKPGATIVEGTAGNTGIGLTLLGRERGYRVVVTMPDNQAREKYEFLEAMGADVRKVPVVPFANENHFFHQARKLAEANGWFWANQFENPANGDYHYETTGPEIWEQCEGKVDVLIGSCGTSGTLSGTSRYLKEKNPKLEVVLVDPYGSGLYTQVKEGKLEATGGSITEGVGIMRLTENFKRARIDDAVRTSDQQMIEMLYHLAREDALVVGTSAALNVRAAYELAKARRGQNLRIVTFLCDHGSRYASKIFNPEFLASKSLQVLPLA